MSFKQFFGHLREINHVRLERFPPLAGLQPGTSDQQTSTQPKPPEVIVDEAVVCNISCRNSSISRIRIRISGSSYSRNNSCSSISKRSSRSKRSRNNSCIINNNNGRNSSSKRSS